MKHSKKSDKLTRELRGQLLNWYDRHQRVLPWRSSKAEKPDPYHVWLSEIMLQQTTVQVVKDYYIKFLSLWPTIHDLAAADEGDVMAAWAGLGYYARARNLHKCAKIVSLELGGKFPSTQDALKKLPGIGDYTSAAITAIAFNKPATVMDGNVERVISRLYNIREPLPQSKPLLKAHAAEFFEDFQARPGDLAQAFMDLGATICIPKAPRCSLCPLNQNCEAYKAGDPQNLPFKSPKKKRPQKYGYVYWIENDRGEVFFEKRPSKGMLGGMIGLPTGLWGEGRSVHPDWITSPRPCNDLFIDHTFTHFDLRLYLFSASKVENEALEFIERPPREMLDSMPSLFQKAMRLYLD